MSGLAGHELSSRHQRARTDQLHGRPHDRRRGPVAAGQLHGHGRAEVRLELQEVADVAAPEPVDRLVRIADRADPRIRCGQQPQQPVLLLVHVLVLVHEHVRPPGTERGRDRRIAVEQRHRDREELVEAVRGVEVHPVLEAELAQDQQAQAVEGGHGDLGRGRLAEQGGEAFPELVAGPAGERDRQAPLGRQAVADPVRDRVREHPGLARARAGHHQQRPAVVGDDRALLGVEGVGPRPRG